MTDQILELITRISTPGFFVTVEFVTISDEMPEGIEAFILQKLAVIRAGASARKFVFRQGKWNLFFTYYPTDKVVEEKYAMKNQVVKTPSRFKT